MEELLIGITGVLIGFLLSTWIAPECADTPSTQIQTSQRRPERTQDFDGIYLESIGTDASNPFGTKAQPGG